MSKYQAQDQRRRDPDQVSQGGQPRRWLTWPERTQYRLLKIHATHNNKLSKAVLTVVGGKDAGQAGQGGVQGAPAEGLDFTAGDHTNRCGHLVLLLLVLGGTDDADIQQLFQAQLGDDGDRRGQQRQSDQKKGHQAIRLRRPIRDRSVGSVCGTGPMATLRMGLLFMRYSLSWRSAVPVINRERKLFYFTRCIGVIGKN